MTPAVLLGNAEPEEAPPALGPGDHACLPFRVGAEDRAVDTFVAGFLADGVNRGERCLLATDPARREGALAELHSRGFPVSELAARGTLLIVDPERFYRPGGRLDTTASLGTTVQVIGQARRDGYRGVRGVSGPLPWSRADQGERERLARYEAEVSALFREQGMAGLCLYDEGTSGDYVLKRVLRTHRQAVIDGRICRNPFCNLTADEDDPGEARWMLRALRQRQAPPPAEYPTGAHTPPPGLVIGRDAEEVAARDALLGALGRQLDPQIAGLEATLAQGPDREMPEACAAALGEWLDRLRERAAGLRRLSTQLGAVVGHLETPLTPQPEPTELGALVIDVLRRWTRDRRLATADLVLSANHEVPGSWDGPALQSIVEALLDLAWDRGWGTRIELAVESLGPTKARLAVSYDDMEVLAVTPEPAATERLMAAARDQLRLALWVPRERARRLGGSLGISLWPQGRVSLTVDLPR